MATPTTRDDAGKFTSQPPAGALAQADARALDIPDRERDDDGDAPVHESPRMEIMRRAREARAKEMGADVVGDASKDKVDTSASDFKETPATEDDESTADAKDRNVSRETKADGEIKDASQDGVPAHVAALADTDLVEIKVNGEVKKLPWGEAKKAIQIGNAADDRLAKAKELEEQARADAAAMRAARRVAEEDAAAAAAARAAAPKAPAGPTPQEHLAAAKEAKRAAHEKYTQAVRYGTDEEITAATKALTVAEDKLDEARDAAVVRPEVAPPVNAEEAFQRIAERNEYVNTQRQSEEYVKAFPEQATDELFRAAASMTLRKELISDLTKLGAPAHIVEQLNDQELGLHHLKARSRNLVRTLDKVFTAAGTKAREELKRRSAPVTSGPDPRLERETRKINTPTMPRTASGRQPEPEPDKPKTAKDMIAETRARRGKA